MSLRCCKGPPAFASAVEVASIRAWRKQVGLKQVVVVLRWSKDCIESSLLWGLQHSRPAPGELCVIDCHVTGQKCLDLLNHLGDDKIVDGSNRQEDVHPLAAPVHQLLELAVVGLQVPALLFVALEALVHGLYVFAAFPIPQKVGGLIKVGKRPALMQGLGLWGQSALR